MSSFHCIGKKFLLFVAVVTAFSCKRSKSPDPVANFFVANNECTAPCYVHFYNQSSDAVSSEWDFGNGKKSNGTNDSTLYPSQGNYTVLLTVLNPEGKEDDISKTITIK